SPGGAHARVLYPRAVPRSLGAVRALVAWHGSGGRHVKENRGDGVVMPSESSLLEIPTTRRALKAVWDCFSWFCAVTVVVGVRYSFDLSAIRWSAVTTYLVLACLLQIGLGLALKLYLGRYRTASFDEAPALAVVAFVVGALLVGYFLAFGDGSLPRAMPFLAPTVALVLMAAGRWVWRLWYRQS